MNFIGGTILARSLIRFSKLRMYNIHLQNELVKISLPETEEFTELNFWPFLDKHKEVIIKRDNSGRGIGIIKVKVQKDGNYEVHLENETLLFPEKRELYSFVHNYTKGSPFIVQQYVPLAKVNDSPFDVRVIVQRKIGSNNWNVTGRYAKVAKIGFFKTNLHAGGSVLPLEEAIKLSSINTNLDIPTLISQIDNLSLEAAKQACSIEKFKDWLIWGIDIGIDNNGNLFLFEANKTPGTKGFRRLPDQSMRKRINKIKAYNRRVRNANKKMNLG